MILLDTSFLLAYVDGRDKNHADALRKQKEIDNERFGTVVITDYIFDEVMTIMMSRIGVARASEYGEKLLKIADLKRIDENIFDWSWKMFKEQKSTGFSFTDCTSIVTCKTYGISTICTFDNEFSKIKNSTIL